MSYYIAYIDVLGTKNSAENENFDEYINLTMCFQSALLRTLADLDDKGRIFFYSDCAYIESRELNTILNVLEHIRKELFDDNIFIRGALVKGKLGALNSINSNDCIERYCDDQNLMNKMRPSLSMLECNKNNKIQGVFFFSKDVAKAYTYESNLKGAAFYVDNNIRDELKGRFVKSGFIADVISNSYKSFYDIKYPEDDITEYFVDKVIRFFISSTISGVKYGRYYLSILISCVNSTNYSKIKYNGKTKKFSEAPAIFYKILEIREKYNYLYENAEGLEFLYFSLLNKFYTDVKNKDIRKGCLKEIFKNSKFLKKYQNKFSELSRDLISPENKYCLTNDVVDISCT